VFRLVTLYSCTVSYAVICLPREKVGTDIDITKHKCTSSVSSLFFHRKVLIATSIAVADIYKTVLQETISEVPFYNRYLKVRIIP